MNDRAAKPPHPHHPPSPGCLAGLSITSRGHRVDYLVDLTFKTAHERWWRGGGYGFQGSGSEGSEVCGGGKEDTMRFAPNSCSRARATESSLLLEPMFKTSSRAVTGDEFCHFQPAHREVPRSVPWLNLQTLARVARGVLDYTAAFMSRTFRVGLLVTSTQPGGGMTHTPRYQLK
ncbi:unnamed protein product [Pleuronectes platessa]|uniref:Uncharacterized protein n=1 Tax=Pleuronectes platessa TaxID=8262 RepID=A0A9N7UFM0_PLEPL|nr:unnamed protein product [Pleuronectes platessa]